MRPGLLALLPALVASAATAGPLPGPTVAAIDAAVTQAMAGQNLPGVAVAISMPEGELFRAWGKADLATGADRTPEQPFRIGSVTKTMIATAILKLAEAGKLAVSDPVSRWFPDFPHADSITVDDLLRMRSGIPDSWSEEALQAFYADPLWSRTADDMIAAAAADAARFAAPDTETVYTNVNYVLLDRIIAKTAGKPTPEVLEELVFAPLGMAASELPTGPDLPGGLHGYSLEGKAGFVDKTTLAPAAVGGAGAAISTLSDLVAFLPALCKGTLLGAAAQAERLTTAQLKGSPPEIRYGQGIGSVGPFCGHNGTIMGFSTEAWYLPTRSASLVISVNRLDADDRSQSTPIFAALAKILFPEEIGR